MGWSPRAILYFNNLTENLIRKVQVLPAGPDQEQLEMRSPRRRFPGIPCFPIKEMGN